MNHVEFKLRLHHPIAKSNILDKWFRVFYVDLVGEDDVYNIKYSYNHVNYDKNKASIIHVTILFDTPMLFEELVEFMNYFTDFDNANVYTLYNIPVNIDLLDDMFIYNKEVFYLQDLTVRNSRINERLSELKHKWDQFK